MGFAQTFVTPTKIGTLDNILSEPSGLIVHYNTSNGHFEYWAHNDKGLPDSIYSFQIDNIAAMNRIIDTNIPFVDWEDMTSDDDGNIYIGDFGNFNNPATELQIVKIPDPNTYGGSTLPSYEIIEFVYPDVGYMDCEAMLHLDGFIYIFTKRVDENQNPNLEEGFVYCLRIPDTPPPSGSVYTAEPWGSFQTIFPEDIPGSPPAGDGDAYRIGSAALSPDKKKMVMNSYNRLWIFSCFEGSDFFNGSVEYVTFDTRQFEGITFINNHELIIAKEGKIPDDGMQTNFPKLYYLNIYDWIDDSCMDCQKLRNGDFSDGTYGWTNFLHGSGNATYSIVNGEAEIDIYTLGTSLWHINLRHKSIVLENGKTYRVTYKAYAEDDRLISLIVNHRSGTPNYTYKQQQITTTPTYYTHEFTMNETTDFNSYFSLNVGNYIAHKVYFDDIRLEEVGCVCPENRDFNAPIANTTMHYKANNTITAQNQIFGDNIIFDAGNCVKLNGEFEVKPQAVLEIYMDGCGN